MISSNGFRSATAVLALLAFMITSTEAVLGMVRDGAVHHETVGEAMAHTGPAESGQHGHAECDEPTSGTDDENHEHGTTSDHCTHVHTTGLLANPNPPWAGSAFTATDHQIPTVEQRSAPPPPGQPPRA